MSEEESMRGKGRKEVEGKEVEGRRWRGRKRGEVVSVRACK